MPAPAKVFICGSQSKTNRLIKQELFLAIGIANVHKISDFNENAVNQNIKNENYLQVNPIPAMGSFE
jgi:hypothetical protein